MIEGWKETTLGEVADKIGMGPFGSNIRVDTFVNEGIPVISGTHLNGLRLEDKAFNFISMEHAERLKTSNVYPGDVIFTHAGNIGQVAYIPQNSHYERYVLSQRQFYLRCNSNELLPEFITYYFKTREGQHKLLANANQTGVPSIAQPVTYLKSISVLLPPLPEQRAIAAVLLSFDDKIELLRRQNKTLEAIAQAIFKEWFVKFKVKGEQLKLNPKTGLPEGWKLGRIKDCGEIVCGKTPPKAINEYFGGSIPFIKIPDMHNEMFIVKTEDSLTEEGSDFQRNKFIPANSVCVSCIATVGLVSITSQKSQTNQQINTIIPNSDEYLEYLYFVLKNMTNDLIAIGSGGSATLNINTGVFSDIEIVLPSDDILKSYHSTVEPLFVKVLSNMIQIQTLSKLRDTLLPKLMKGEIRVKL